MKKIIFTLLSLTTLLLTGCENDADLKLDVNAHQLVINGLINADSTYNYITISLSGVDSVKRVTNALVQVSVNGAVKQNITYDDGYSITTPFKAGDRVRIDVATSDHQYSAYVEETIPQPVKQIDGITVKRAYRHYYTNNEGEYSDTLWCYEVSFGDITGENDYYRLMLRNDIRQEFHNIRINNGDTLRNQQSVTHFFPESDNIWYDDPIMMDGQTADLSDIGTYVPALGTIFNRYGIFNDVRFKDKTCRISVADNLNNYPQKHIEEEDSSATGYYHSISYNLYSIDVTFSIESIIKSEYNYLKSLNQYHSSAYDDNSDITGPIKFPSNVHGGIGMVGFSISTSKTIHLQ